LDALVVKHPVVYPVDLLRELLYRWRIEFAKSGALPTSRLALAWYLKFFRHHGYPNLAPSFPNLDVEYHKKWAVDALFWEFRDKVRRERASRYKIVKDALRSKDLGLVSNAMHCL
jgi:hypothetical protein